MKNTIVIAVEEQNIDIEALKQAGEMIRRGGLVAFPTETVYGLGGNALNEQSARKIYEAKGRPSDNPLIVHICRLEDLSVIADGIPEVFYQIAEKFWPGPLTIILNKSEGVPAETTGGLSTVAVRMPANKIALALIEAAGGFVAAPSANVSGRPSPTSAKYVTQDMHGRIDMILDGGDADFGLESTILDLTGQVPMILRPGAVTQKMLEDILGNVLTDSAISGEVKDGPPKAPGMKYRHYAPQGQMVVVEGDRQQVVKYINVKLKEKKEAGEKTGVLCTDVTSGAYQADSIKSLGSSSRDETRIAKNLYRVLREFDDEQITMIYAEAVDGSQGMGQAIMNRMLKAAGHQLIVLENHTGNK